MRVVTIAGPPSSGKTAVATKTLAELKRRGLSVGAIKLDCLYTEDHERYAKLGIPSDRGLSGGLCPDHYFASNLEDMCEWGTARQLDLLVTESAGLCCRCSPHVTGLLAVCVIDCLGGSEIAKKVGPMLKLADIVVITKGDLVSQAEREVFGYSVHCVNARAKLLFVNGHTGQGVWALAGLWQNCAEPVARVQENRLRFPMPAALCSYCLGETRLGQDYQIGNLRKLELQDG